MKIVHIINSVGTGGAEKLIVDSLPKYEEKLDVDLIVLKDLGDKSIFNNKLEKDFKGKITYLTKGSVYNPLLIFKLAPLLGKYELAHIHLFPTLYWVVLAKIFFFKKVKLIFTEHNTTNKRRDKSYLKPIEKFIYSKLDMIGCISEATKNNLLEHLETNNSKIKVISNGIDLNNFNPSKVDKIEYDFFDKESFIFAQVSSFTKQKDQDTLVRALAQLPEKFKLLLIGNGPRIEEVKKLSEDLNVSNRVKFLGNRIDIPQLLSYTNVSILSSHFEGFGLTIVEGMAMGKPSIASNVDGIKEIITGYGLVFEKGNEKELVKSLIKLESDTNYYRNISESCLNRSKKYDLKYMIESYISEYKNTIRTN